MQFNETDYIVVKKITSLAGPLLTSASGLLGLFARTHEEYEEVEKSKKIVKKQRLTHWAWISMLGIVFGGIVSILGLVAQDEIDEIADKRKLAFERERSGELERIDTKSSKLITKLYDVDTLASSSLKTVNEALELSKAIANNSRLTKGKLDETFNKQQTSLLLIDSVLKNATNAANPLFPMKTTIFFEAVVALKAMEYLKNKVDSLKHRSIPDYFDIRGDRIIVNRHPLPDPNTPNHDKLFDDIHSMIEHDMLPQFIFSFYKQPYPMDSFKVRFPRKEADLEIRAQASYVDPKRPETRYLSSYDVSYELDFESRRIFGLINFTDPTPNAIRKDNLKSLYAGINGVIFIEHFYIRYADSIRVRQVNFRCGANFTDSYTADFDEKDVIDGIYMKKISEFIY